MTYTRFAHVVFTASLTLCVPGEIVHARASRTLLQDIANIVVEDDGRWIRTDAWALPPLRLAAHTYWLYRTVDDDVMLRLVYDREGRIVWQYRMVRIAHAETQRTRFYEAWRSECEGRGYGLAL